MFAAEKDLRHYESIRVKAQYFTGIVLRCKILSPQNMDNILKAIELDNINFKTITEKEDNAKKEKENAAKEKIEKEKLLNKTLSKKSKDDAADAPDIPEAFEADPVPEPEGDEVEGDEKPAFPKFLHNLRIEDTKLSKRTVHTLASWLKTKHMIVSFGINKVKFEEPNDFKVLMEALQLSAALQKLTIQNMVFNLEIHGKSVGNTL